MVNHVFLDMDPGIDDAAAIMMISAHPEWKIEGIAAVSGNVEVEKGAENALKIVDAIGIDSEVFRGASRPLVKEAHFAYGVHGRDGLGGIALNRGARKLSDQYGPIAMIEAARKNSKMRVLATGPLTNIAITAILEPDFPGMIGGLVIMGGAYNLSKYGKGNVTKHSEFNIWADPEAAAMVFSLFRDAAVIGLDITADPRVWISRDEIEKLRQTKRSAILRGMTRKFVNSYGAFVPHDPIAAYYLLDPGSFKTERHCIEVSTGRFRGMTTACACPDKLENIATSLDAGSFRSAFLKAMERA